MYSYNYSIIIVLSNDITYKYVAITVSLANFCGKRCESLNDNTSCLACNAGYQPPNCCECEEGYLSLGRQDNIICCQNSMIDIEGTYNNCEYLNSIRYIITLHKRHHRM